MRPTLLLLGALSACGVPKSVTTRSPGEAAAPPSTGADVATEPTGPPLSAADIALLNAMEIAEPRATGLVPSSPTRHARCIGPGMTGVDAELAEQRAHLLGEVPVERFCAREYVADGGNSSDALWVFAMRFESADAARAASTLDSFVWLGTRLEQLGMEVGRAGPLLFFVRPDQQPMYAAAAEVWPAVARRLKEYAADLAH